MDMNFDNNHDFQDDFLLYNEIEKTSEEEYYFPSCSNQQTEINSEDDLSKSEWIASLVISVILTIIACGILEVFELTGIWLLIITGVLFVVNTIISMAIVVFFGGMINKNKGR